MAKKICPFRSLGDKACIEKKCALYVEKINPRSTRGECSLRLTASSLSTVIDELRQARAKAFG